MAQLVLELTRIQPDGSTPLEKWDQLIGSLPATVPETELVSASPTDTATCSEKSPEEFHQLQFDQLPPWADESASGRSKNPPRVISRNPAKVKKLISKKVKISDTHKGEILE